MLFTLSTSVVEGRLKFCRAGIYPSFAGLLKDCGLALFVNVLYFIIAALRPIDVAHVQSIKP